MEHSAYVSALEYVISCIQSFSDQIYRLHVIIVLYKIARAQNAIARTQKQLKSSNKVRSVYANITKVISSNTGSQKYCSEFPAHGTI